MPGKSQMIDESLSLEEFCAAAKSFIERWNKIQIDQPKWRWVAYQSTHQTRASNNMCKKAEEGYLSLENVYHFNQESNGKSGSSEYDSFDCATVASGTEDEVHIYDYHIVYSFSYKVPVLYFRGYRSDGQPLSLDAIQKDLPCHSSRILKESKWTYITQEDHPHLHRPWYTLHPCGTSNWMKLLQDSDFGDQSAKVDRYLPSWLSVVGQAVGLELPLGLHIVYCLTFYD